MQVTIRKAEPRDVPAMLALVKELAVFEKEPEAVTVTEAEMLEAGFGKDPVWFGWVACRSDDQKVRRSDDGNAPKSGDQMIGQSDDGSRSSDHPIGTSSDPILGIAICYERYSTWKGRRLYLEDIVVTEKARGHRIGEKLFKQCAAYAVEQNYSGMLWQVLDWNKDAIRFYDRFGAGFSNEWLNGSLERGQLLNLAAE